MIGVAGKYCSGKDALVEFLLARGFQGIDVDRVGHSLLEDPQIRRRIVEAFGASIQDAQGRIDRSALGAVVFGRARALRRLEAILHPSMVERVAELLEQSSGPAVINAAVLFRMGLERFCDLVICVRARFWRRLIRACRRDRTTLVRILGRMRAQRGICPKLIGAAVDIYYVDNNRGLEDLKDRVREILREKGL